MTVDGLSTITAGTSTIVKVVAAGTIVTDVEGTIVTVAESTSVWTAGRSTAMVVVSTTVPVAAIAVEEAGNKVEIAPVSVVACKPAVAVAAE